MTCEDDFLHERKSRSMLEAIRFWLPRTDDERRNGELRVAFAQALVAYGVKTKIDMNKKRLPVIWLRLLQEVRSKTDGSLLPDIDPLALECLLDSEQRRQAKDRILLYREINPSTEKSSGPIRRHTPSLNLVGYTTLEILLTPVPEGESAVSWPYNLEWRTAIRTRSSKATRARGSYDSYTKKWRGLMSVLEKCLETEVMGQGTSRDAALEPTPSGAARPYKTTMTFQALAALLSARHQEIREYSVATVRRALSGCVIGCRGRPKKTKQKTQKPSRQGDG